VNESQANYLELLARLDAFTARVVERYPGMLQCKRGCDDCCQRDLSLFPIEADRLIEQARSLPQEQIDRVLDRARAALADDEAWCPFLDSTVRGGACLVYRVRPVICRSHGLPLLIPEQNSLSLCPHNFKGVHDIAGACVLDLAPVNQILAATNLLRARELDTSPERVQLSRAVVDALSEGS
jgi:hypothetical protein